MHYLDEGEGMPVILLHGNPTWSFMYRELVKHLRSDFRCIVPDHMGCGLSEKPQKYTYRLKDHIDNLLLLIEHLGLESFHLVVHDWGGAIGFGAALQVIDRVKRIQVLNTAAFRSNRIPLSIRLCRIPLLGELWVRGCNGFALPATRMAVEKKLSENVKQGYLFPYFDWDNRIATHRFVKDIPLSKGHVSYPELLRIEEGLAQFKEHPLNILWGGKDFCFNKAFYEEWRHRFPNASAHCLPDAGHYLLEDATEVCLERIAEFLKG